MDYAKKPRTHFADAESPDSASAEPEDRTRIPEETQICFVPSVPMPERIGGVGGGGTFDEVSGSPSDAQNVCIFMEGHQMYQDNDATKGVGHHNWMAGAASLVLDVRCKGVTGQLHKARLGSGGRGRCILRQGEWLTPTEFEALSGRAQSKDWKRSIRLGGKTLQSVIDVGLLHPHAANCMCAICCDDPAVTAPVKPFTPYRKRRFRHASDTTPLVVLSARDADGGEEVDVSPPASHEVDSAEDISALPSDIMWSRLEEMSCSLLRQALTMKQVIRAYREKASASTAGESVHCGGEETSTPPEPCSVAPANSARQCANCDRAPLLECALCRRTTYCTRFCCAKDWPSHRAACGHDAPAASVMFVLADGSDRLITVSQTQ